MRLVPSVPGVIGSSVDIFPSGHPEATTRVRVAEAAGAVTPVVLSGVPCLLPNGGARGARGAPGTSL